MSRIGNNPILVPEGVIVDLQENRITVKGKIGELSQKFSDISILLEKDKLIISRESDQKDVKSKHGLYRSLINNMIFGVSEGYVKELELVGVGYRASNQGQKLDLALGFSHNILFEISPEIKVETISEKGKNALLSCPILTKAACIPGITFSTTPL